MLDLTVIILTKDEKLHIARCIENIKPIAKSIIVIDSFSTDGTQEIARSLGAEVIEHKWPGNQAAQFNWAIDNIKIDTKWILRIDADEYLLPELIEELKQKLPYISDDVNGIVLKRRHIFLDKWMKHGIYPVKLLRLYRKGHARYEQRMMDEHLILSDGKEIEFDNDFCDHNLNNISWFCKKHIDYAIREAAEILTSDISDKKPDEAQLIESSNSNNLSSQAQKKRNKKSKYNSLPLFWRSFAYFLYRYFLKGAWREGKEGFVFSFLQGWWYRTLVDAKVMELKKQSNNDPEKLREILKKQYNISI